MEEMGDLVSVGAELDRIHRPKPQWGLLALTVGLCPGGRGASGLADRGLGGALPEHRSAAHGSGLPFGVWGPGGEVFSGALLFGTLCPGHLRGSPGGHGFGVANFTPGGGVAIYACWLASYMFALVELGDADEKLDQMI